MTYFRHNICGGATQRPTWSRRGVTLVELLVVITILGLLAVTVLPNIGGTIDSRRSREASRGISMFISRAQSRALGAKDPKGFQIQPLTGDAAVAIDFYVADVPPAYAGELSSSTVRLLPGDSFFTKNLVFSDAGTNTRVRRDGGFCYNGDSIQFGGVGSYFKFVPGVPGGIPPAVTMWTANNQNPFNTSLPQTGINFPFRIRRQPKPASTGVYQMSTRAAVDLRWSSLGGELFSDFVTLNDNQPDPITILFDAAGRPIEFVHSNGIRRTIGVPIFLLLGLAELCGNDPVKVNPDDNGNNSDENPNVEPEKRNGANWQYFDGIWLYIDHQSGLVRTAPSAARQADIKYLESIADGKTENAAIRSAVLESQYNIRASIGLGVRE